MKIMRKTLQMMFIALVLAMSFCSMGYADDDAEARKKLEGNIIAGRTAYQQRQFSEAEGLFRISIEQARSLHNDQAYAFAYSFLGATQARMNKLNEALETLLQAELEQKKAKEPLSKTVILMGYVELYSKLGDHVNTQKYIKAILSESDTHFHILSISRESYKKNYEIAKMLQRVVSSFSVSKDDENYFEDVLANHKVLHWNTDKRVINVYLPSGSSYMGWKPDYTESFKKACLTWESVLENRIKFQFVTNPGDSDVMISWLPVESYRAGTTDISVYSNQLANADINLNFGDGDNRFVEPAEIYILSLHELGHLLGMVGHSKNPNDIMFPSITYATELSERDIATIRMIYSKDADISNPVDKTLAEYRKELHAKGKYPTHNYRHF